MSISYSNILRLVDYMYLSYVTIDTCCYRGDHTSHGLRGACTAIHLSQPRPFCVMNYISTTLSLLSLVSFRKNTTSSEERRRGVGLSWHVIHSLTRPVSQSVSHSSSNPFDLLPLVVLLCPIIRIITNTKCLARESSTRSLLPVGSRRT